MNMQQAMEILAGQGLVVRNHGDELIVGGTKITHLDERDADLITGATFGIHYEAPWWIAAFSGCAVTQISSQLSVAVQSICNVFKTDNNNQTDYSSQIPNALIDLQREAHLPVLVVDWLVLEIYQRSSTPQGLERRYGNFLSDWWVPSDTPEQPVGEIRLQNDQWVVKSIYEDRTIIVNSLENAVQAATTLFGKHRVYKTSPI